MPPPARHASTTIKAIKAVTRTAIMIDPKNQPCQPAPHICGPSYCGTCAHSGTGMTAAPVVAAAQSAKRRYALIIDLPPAYHLTRCLTHHSSLGDRFMGVIDVQFRH